MFKSISIVATIVAVVVLCVVSSSVNAVNWGTTTSFSNDVIAEVAIASGSSLGKACIVNGNGKFYFESLGDIINLYECSDTTCATGCTVRQNWTTSDNNKKSYIYGDRKMNWTADVYAAAGGIMFHQKFSSTGCTANKLTAATYWAQSSAVCLPDQDASKSYKRYCSSSSLPTTITYDNLDCSGNGTATSHSSSCDNVNHQVYTCDSSVGYKTVTFNLASSAGKIMMIVVVTISAFLMVIV